MSLIQPSIAYSQGSGARDDPPVFGSFLEGFLTMAAQEAPGFYSRSAVKSADQEEAISGLSPL